jgi:hypothetical protein
MKKLHETYLIKLREAEQWPDRLRSELNREREQHRVKMNELELSLKESFATVCIINLILKINNKYLIGIEY